MDIYKITEIFAYLIIYSFLGWVIETIYKSVIEKRVVNSGFIYGPFCLIYGIGAFIMYFFLDDFKNNILVLFLISTVVMSAWEYFAGSILERLFRTKYWDYSEQKFNFQGRICLKTSIYWGMLGVIFTTLIHPVMTELVDNVPENILMKIVLLLMIYIIVDIIISSIKVINIEKGISKLKELEETVRLKLEELKTLGVNSKSRVAVNNVIAEIKDRQEGIKERVLKQTMRLKNAFPSMKSEKINEFLSQKIEIFKNDKKR